MKLYLYSSNELNVDEIYLGVLFNMNVMDRLKFNFKSFLLSLLVLSAFVVSCKKKENKLIFNVKGSYDFIGTVEKDNQTYFGFCKYNFQPEVQFLDKAGMK